MSLKIEELSKRELMHRYGFDRYNCRITGTIDGIRLEDACPDYANMYDVELWHEKEHNGMCRIPALEQTGYIPAITYKHLCDEVKKYFTDKKITSQLSPNTLKTFGGLIEDL
jgi:hypothetical protein